MNPDFPLISLWSRKGSGTLEACGPGNPLQVLNIIDQRRLTVIRKLKSGKYRLYSSKKDPSTGKRKNLGTFDSREKAEKHERAVQFFKDKH